MDVPQVFPFKQSSEDALRTEAIKWTIAQSKTKYEVYVHTLKEFELEKLLPHCLEIKAKINSVVGTQSHMGPSMYQVFPRSLSPVLQGVWNHVVVGAPAAKAEETVAHFENRL